MKQYPSSFRWRGLWSVLLMLVCFAAQTSPAATISACSQPSSVPATQTQRMYDASGRLVTLALTDATPDGECATLQLPGPAVGVRWLALHELPVTAQPRRLVLQGLFDTDTVVVSEVIHDQPVQTEPDFLPLRDDIRLQFTRFAFGVEERAVLADNGELTCGAGKQPAGVVLQVASRWPPLGGMSLEVTASGSGRFEILVADATQQLTGAAQPLGVLELAPEAPPQVRQMPMPQGTTEWSSLTLLCPPQTARVQLSAVRLLPPASVVRTSARAAWFWSPDLWLNRQAAIWTLATQERLRRIYITVPVTADGRVAESGRLARFLREARRRGIAVWVVTGDRDDVLPGNAAPLLARTQAYLAFNAAQRDDARLAGLQLDIEPYLLPGFALAGDYWRQRYVETVLDVRTTIDGQLPLDLVMPVWWGTHANWGSRLLSALALPGVSFTVMNYRTDPRQLRAGALPFLAFAQASGNAVTMALETGRLGVVGGSGNVRSESRYYFEATTGAGELWQFDLAGTTLLVLFDQRQQGLPGRAYRRSSEVIFNTGAISFTEARNDWHEVAAQMETEWQAWLSFAGLAIHGLDQTLSDEE